MAKHLHNKRPQQARQGCYKTRLLQLDESRSRSSTPSPKHCSGLASSHLHPSRKNRPQCLRGNKAPRGRPPSPTRRRAQSPSQNPAGLGFSPAQLLQCAEFQCGSFPLLASGLDRQTDRRTGRRTGGGEGGSAVHLLSHHGTGGCREKGQDSHRPGVPIKSPLQLGRQFRSSRCIPGQGPFLPAPPIRMSPIQIKNSPNFAHGLPVLSKNSAG